MTTTMYVCRKKYIRSRVSDSEFSGIRDCNTLSITVTYNTRHFGPLKSITTLIIYGFGCLLIIIS